MTTTPAEPSPTCDSILFNNAAAMGKSPLELVQTLLQTPLSLNDLPTFYNYMVGSSASSAGADRGLGVPPELARAIIRALFPTAARSPALIIGLLVSAGAVVVAFAGCALFNSDDDDNNKRSA